MDRLAPDHAAERDDEVKAATPLLRGIERDRDRSRNFQRARNGNDIVCDAGRFQLGRCALQQRVQNIVI